MNIVKYLFKRAGYVYSFDASDLQTNKKEVVIYGTGEVGRRLKNYLERAGCHVKFFIETDLQETGKEVEGLPVHNQSVLKEFPSDYFLVEAGRFWREMEQTVRKMNNRIERFYVDSPECLFMPKEIGAISNEKFIRFMAERERSIDKAVANYRKKGELSECITRVSFGLSNLCNYAMLHKLCPAAHIGKKEILDTETIFKVIEELSIIDFHGTIAFHIYNEPSIDPRLFYLIDHVREKLGHEIDIMIHTNGYYLNEVMIQEYVNIGVTVLMVTAYGDAEFKRTTALNVPIAYYVVYENMDQRLDNYNELQPEVKCGKICRGACSDVSIYSDGTVGLCCLDYKHPYGLGNVKEKGLLGILADKKMNIFQQNIIDNNRIYPICKRCGFSR